MVPMKTRQIENSCKLIIFTKERLNRRTASS
jgi:hypothetical protein